MDSAMQLIGQLGFPIFVCLWFMWRDYKFLTSLQELLDGIKEEIGKMNLLIDALLKERL
jgi:hypothetical protein